LQGPRLHAQRPLCLLSPLACMTALTDRVYEDGERIRRRKAQVYYNDGPVQCVVYDLPPPRRHAFNAGSRLNLRAFPLFPVDKTTISQSKSHALPLQSVGTITRL